MSDYHGVVYTKEWVVGLILDMAGYSEEKPLWKQRAIEPSCGEGSFLRLMTRRLAKAATRDKKLDVDTLACCIKAYDLDERSVEVSKAVVRAELESAGFNSFDSGLLADKWVICDDYLLADDETADYVLGNPPYIRSIEIPRDARTAYCKRYSAMTAGSDVFVAFIQRGLESLSETGVLCFICADRWMQNQYGRSLRALISEKYHLSAILKMHDVDAFEANVSAYPAITRIDCGRGPVLYADCKAQFGPGDCKGILTWLDNPGEELICNSFEASAMPQPSGANLIPLTTPAKARLIGGLMGECPSIEDTGVRLGIGIATGRDSVFITDNQGIAEEERLLPVFNMRDWRRGLRNKDRWLVNPWNPDGSLINLEDYPRTKEYFEGYRETLSKRHVAKRNSEAWYRTIDKVNPSIMGKPMLLFPDMANRAEPVYSNGDKYPCHNCYWLVSDSWDLKVLGGLLMSDVAEAFVDALGVKMRGGTLRFQAQYLRLIHVPYAQDIDDVTANDLKRAFERGDRESANSAARRAYGLEE